MLVAETFPGGSAQHQQEVELFSVTAHNADILELFDSNTCSVHYISWYLKECTWQSFLTPSSTEQWPDQSAWRGKSQSNACYVELWLSDLDKRWTQWLLSQTALDMWCAVTGTTLVGAEQSRQWMSPLPTNSHHQLYWTSHENMRAKIYALCTKLGFQCPSNSLTTEDKITMCIIQSYLDFKVSEYIIHYQNIMRIDFRQGRCGTS